MRATLILSPIPPSDTSHLTPLAYDLRDHVGFAGYNNHDMSKPSH